MKTALFVEHGIIPEWYTSTTANKPMKTQIVLCNDPVLNIIYNL